CKWIFPCRKRSCVWQPAVFETQVLEVRMKARIESEVKIFGINFFIVSAAFTVAIIVLSIIAGNLLDFYPVSFEVVFPFFVTIVVGEWGKTRADSNFDIIAAQSKSVFKWVLLVYLIGFAIYSLFADFIMG